MQQVEMQPGVLKLGMLKKPAPFPGRRVSFPKKSLLLSSIVLALCLPAVAAGQQQATTSADDDTATLRFVDGSAKAVNEGDGTVTIPVTLGAAVSGGAEVVATIVHGGTNAPLEGIATAADLAGTAFTQILTFAGTAGETQDVSVTINDDSIMEGDETFTVSLTLDDSITTGMTAGPPITVTIIDNVIPPETPELTIGASRDSISEGETVTVTLKVTEAMSAAFEALVTVSGTGITAGDFAEGVAGRTATFAAGARTATLALTTLDDSLVEGAEVFSVRIESVTDGSVTIGSASSADEVGDASIAVTIHDNDFATLALDVASTMEVSEDVGVLQIPVTLSAAALTPPSAAALGGGRVAALGSVIATITHGETDSADFNSLDEDFTSPEPGYWSQTLTFTGTLGETQNLSVPIKDDSLMEPSETFTVTLSDPTNTGVTLGASVITVTITDNDDGATLSLNAAARTVCEAAREVTIPVTLSAAALGGVKAAALGGLSLTATITHGETDCADFISLTTIQTLTFAGTANETQNVSLTINDDSILEPSETFTVTLSNPAGVALGISVMTLTITDNDGVPLSFNAATMKVNEGDGEARIPFTIGSTADLGLGPRPGVQPDDAMYIKVTATITHGETKDTDFISLATAQIPTFSETAGHTEHVIVRINDDHFVEKNETFRVTLSATLGTLFADAGGPSPVTLGISEITVTIRDDDRLGSVPNAHASRSGGDGGGPAADVTPPQATIKAPKSVRSIDGAFPLEITFSEQVEGFDEAADLAVSGATVGEIVPATDVENQFQVTLTPDASFRELRVQVVAGAATNEAGNLSEASDVAVVRIVSLSTLIAARDKGANAALRRHAQRFGGLTASVTQRRLKGASALQEHWAFRLDDSEGRKAGKLSLSCRGGGRTCAWADGAVGRISGSAKGRYSDVYAGIDYLGSGFVVGVLTGFSDSSLTVGEAGYDASYREVGVYGGLRLGKGLIADVAASWGKATPKVSQEAGEGAARETLSGRSDADRLLVRAALSGTGTWSAAQGRLAISPRLGALYVEEELGNFVDDTGALASAEKRRLMQLEVGPKMVYSHPSGGKLTLEVPLKWDTLGRDDDPFSGGVKASLQMPLMAGLSFTLHGNYDGLGSENQLWSGRIAELPVGSGLQPSSFLVRGQRRCERQVGAALAVLAPAAG